MYMKFTIGLWVLYIIIFITVGFWNVYGFVWIIMFIIISTIHNLDYALLKIKYNLS